MGMLDRMRGDLVDRYERMAERTDQYKERVRQFERGEISTGERMVADAEQALAGAATAIGTVADPVGRLILEAADYLTPPQVDQALKELAGKAMQTGAAQSLLQLAKENPRIAASLMDAVDVAGAFAGQQGTKKVAGEFAKELAQAAPNKQKGSFYTGGLFGQGSSVLRTAPQSILDTLYAYTSPKAMAELRTKPKALQRVAKEALEQKDSKAASWVEGQADQQVMLMEASSKPLSGPLADFKDAQYTVVGELDEGKLREIISVNPNVKAYGMELDDDLISTLHRRIMKAQKVSPTEPAPLVMGRHDNMFSKVLPEYKKAHGADVVNNLYRASIARQDIYGDTPKGRGFVDQDDFLDFVALARVEQKALQKFGPDGPKRSANWLDRKIHRWLGEIAEEKFNIKPKQSREYANKTIDAFYALQKDIEEADKLADQFKQQAKKIKEDNPNVNFKKSATGPDKEVIKAYKAAIAAEMSAHKKVRSGSRQKYAEIKKRLNDVKADLDIVGEEGNEKVFFGDTHKSRIKALGGVNDQVVIDRKGNVLTVINDENDLFNLVPPGHQRTIAVPLPFVYNVFNRQTPVSLSVVTDKPKEKFTSSMLKQGATKGGKSTSALNQQLAEAILKYEPEVSPVDVSRVRKMQAGMLTGTTTLGAMNEKEQ